MQGQSRYADKRRKYQNAIKTISRIAADRKVPASKIAREIAADRRVEIELFVKQMGEQPSESLLELIAQAVDIHETNVQRRMSQGISSYEVAENDVLADYVLLEDKGDIDEFDPATLGALFSGVTGAIQGINAKRAASGKPPLLSGRKGKAAFLKAQDEALKAAQANQANGADQDFNSQQWNTGDDDDPSNASIVVKSLADQLRAAETKKQIGKMMPLIIVVAVVIFLAGKKL